jgi:DDB1- and CUL4-associated factor 13
MDNRFILSGSEDTNIRIWKAQAAAPLKALLPREKESLAYSEKLKRKYQNNPEIKRILRHRHLPAIITKKKKTVHNKRESRFKKDQNMRTNNRPEDRPFIPQRSADMDYKIE